MLKTKRVYESDDPEDGERYLVERLWPRGIKKEALRMKAWIKDVAPSPELRKWYQHDPEKWPEFQLRYRAELENNPDPWGKLLESARETNVTLLYSASDTQRNSAVLLQNFLEERLASRQNEKHNMKEKTE
jgi:uncharacterized protein YeaO (DUF488 family)